MNAGHSSREAKVCCREEEEQRGSVISFKSDEGDVLSNAENEVQDVSG